MSDHYSELPEHVRTLLRQGGVPWPGVPELVQTHISYVLLWETQVLKIKKARTLGFLDFGDLDKRRLACFEEVRVNSRGCASTYLEVLPISRVEGGYLLGDSSDTVDWAVHMRRLPAAGMMDRMLSEGRVGFEEIEALVVRLTDYYASAEASDEISRIGSAENFARRLFETLDAAAQFEDAPTSELIRRIKELAGQATESATPLLHQRVRENRVRDCHGDLRSDAICFDPVAGGICLFDAIEFDVRYRYQDMALDVAFLAMDLDFRGRPDLSDLLVGWMLQSLKDPSMPLVLPLYKSYRAAVRGLVELIACHDHGIDGEEREKAAGRAGHYMQLAENYLTRSREHFCIVVMGPSGTGKSTIAGATAARFGAELASSDLLRAEVLPAEATDRYSQRQRDLVYAGLVAKTREAVSRGHSVVVDATFILASERAGLLAVLSDVPYLVIECRADAETVRRRQLQRSTQGWGASEGTWDVYKDQVARYEPPVEVPRARLLQVDTAQPLSALLDLIEQKLDSI